MGDVLRCQTFWRLWEKSISCRAAVTQIIRTALSAAIFALVGTGLPVVADELEDYTRQVDRLEQFAKENRVGEGRNYWLTMQNVMGDAEKIALVFGLSDDLAFCNTMADAYRRQYPNTRLFCTPAN